MLAEDFWKSYPLESERLPYRRSALVEKAFSSTDRTNIYSGLAFIPEDSLTFPLFPSTAVIEYDDEEDTDGSQDLEWAGSESMSLAGSPSLPLTGPDPGQVSSTYRKPAAIHSASTIPHQIPGTHHTEGRTSTSIEEFYETRLARQDRRITTLENEVCELRDQLTSAIQSFNAMNGSVQVVASSVQPRDKSTDMAATHLHQNIEATLSKQVASNSILCQACSDNRHLGLVTIMVILPTTNNMDFPPVSTPVHKSLSTSHTKSSHKRTYDASFNSRMHLGVSARSLASGESHDKEPREYAQDQRRQGKEGSDL